MCCHVLVSFAKSGPNRHVQCISTLVTRKGCFHSFYFTLRLMHSYGASNTGGVLRYSITYFIGNSTFHRFYCYSFSPCYVDVPCLVLAGASIPCRASSHGHERVRIGKKEQWLTGLFAILTKYRNVRLQTTRMLTWRANSAKKVSLYHFIKN